MPIAKIALMATCFDRISRLPVVKKAGDRAEKTTINKTRAMSARSLKSHSRTGRFRRRGALTAEPAPVFGRSNSRIGSFLVSRAVSDAGSRDQRGFGRFGAVELARDFSFRHHQNATGERQGFQQ